MSERYFVTAVSIPNSVMFDVGDPNGYETRTLPVMLATELSKQNGVVVIIEHRTPKRSSPFGYDVVYAELFQGGRKTSA